MIELENVSKVFKGPQGKEIAAVKRLSLVVRKGETVCLLGTSGSGKTTAIKMINRLIEPSSGQIRIDGCNIESMDVITLRRKIGYVIQSGGLFPHMTVARNIGLLCEIEKWPREKIKQRVAELLDLVNLPYADFADRYPAELSGGQRQRVGVARALALDPAYILMDEPFGALDPITRTQLHHEFQQLESKVKKTIILVTHDLAEAFKLGDRIGLMNEGQLIQVGSEDEFRSRPANQFVSDFLQGHLKSEERHG